MMYARSTLVTLLGIGISIAIGAEEATSYVCLVLVKVFRSISKLFSVTVSTREEYTISPACAIRCWK